jgi:hypothetical protein
MSSVLLLKKRNPSCLGSIKHGERRGHRPFSAADSMGDLPSPSRAFTSAPHCRTRTLIVSISPASTGDSVRVQGPRLLGFGV